jgi:hypothetical protein
MATGQPIDADQVVQDVLRPHGFSCRRVYKLLSQFFERENRNGVRHYVDEKITEVNPNFMCHKDAAAS